MVKPAGEQVLIHGAQVPVVGHSNCETLKPGDQIPGTGKKVGDEGVPNHTFQVCDARFTTLRRGGRSRDDYREGRVTIAAKPGQSFPITPQSKVPVFKSDDVVSITTDEPMDLYSTGSKVTEVGGKKVITSAPMKSISASTICNRNADEALKGLCEGEAQATVIARDYAQNEIDHFKTTINPDKEK